MHRIARNFAPALIALLVVGASHLANAHHSPALFDLSNVMTLDATVTRFEWVNPHAFVHVEVTANGQTEVWRIEADAPSTLIPLGWSRDSLKPGDRVTVEVSPHRNAKARALLGRSIRKSDGAELMPKPMFVREPSRPSSSAAEGIAGVWLPRRENYFAFVNATNGNDWSLTPAAGRVRDAYDGVQTPQADCVAVSAPAIMLYPVHTEIVVLSDRVLVRKDWMDVERVIYTDGRGHPESGERTSQGHTVGHWNGATLEMDTELFEEHILGTNGRVPSGRQKRVKEWLSLSDDRKSLTYKFSLEDAEYLQEAVTGESTWDFRPDLPRSDLPCDENSAKSPLLE
jgi:hypothetical protein